MSASEWLAIVEGLEHRFQLKSVHNELKMVLLLAAYGPMPSLELFRRSRRSSSGHNSDLKRLRGLGIVDCTTGPNDRREKMYDLSADFREKFRIFVEEARSAMGNEKPRTAARTRPERTALGRTVSPRGRRPINNS
jgi:DNA-binding MarR family transcriptional regulator